MWRCLLGDAGVGQAGVLVLLLFPSAELFLNRKLSFPVSRMWQWWVSRSSSAVVILVSPKILPHSLKLRFVVMTTLVRFYSLLSR